SPPPASGRRGRVVSHARGRGGGMTEGTGFEAVQRGVFDAIEEGPAGLANWLVLGDVLGARGPPPAAGSRLRAHRRLSPDTVGAAGLAGLAELLSEGERPCLPRHVNSLGMEFTLVPRGTFWMSKADRNAQRRVEVPYS